MKYIKQKSTGKIVHRDLPHTDQTLGFAVYRTGISENDLEVVESDWTEDEWTVAMNNQLPYGERRKAEYAPIPEQLDMLWHAIDLDTLDKTSDFYNNLKAVKDKYPKGDN